MRVFEPTALRRQKDSTHTKYVLSTNVSQCHSEHNSGSVKREKKKHTTYTFMSTLSFKKVATGILSVLVAFTMIGGASVAQAASLTQAQIDSIVGLLESFGADAQTVADVEATLKGEETSGGSTGGSTSGSCDYTFATDLSMGDTGADVMHLQEVLNMNAATQVAASGIGSAGNESSYFGALTKTAVVKFQEYYASEILAPVGLTAGTGYVGASTRAQLNAVCADGTDNGAGDGDQAGDTSGLHVAAGNQPSNSLAPASATNIPFTVIELTNNGSSDVTVDSIVVKRTGLASDDAFTKIVVLDEDGLQIGDDDTLDSDHEAVVGDDIEVEEGESVTLTIAATRAAASTANTGDVAGDVASFSVIAINTDAAVSGSLPITGAQHTINDTLDIGSITVDKGGDEPSTSDKQVGEEDVTIGSFNLEAGSNEDVVLNTVRIHQDGNADPASAFDNVVAEFMNDDYDVDIDGDYLIVDLGGVVLEEGVQEDLDIVADIVGGGSDTVKLEIKEETDIVGYGEDYGYGVAVSAATAWGTDNVNNEFSITGGDFNISKESSVDDDEVAEGAANQILGAFEVDNEDELVEAEEVVLTNTDSLTDNYDIDNVRLVDEDGEVLAGPEDNDTTDGTVTFDNVEFPVGEYIVYIKGELDEDDFSNGDEVTFTVAVNDIVGQVSDEDIADISAVTLQTMTVESAAVELSMGLQPDDDTVLAGTSDYHFATIQIDADESGEDIEFNQFSVKLNETATSTQTDELKNCALYLDGDKISDEMDGDELDGTNGGEFDLDDTLVVAKNTVTELDVMCDVDNPANGTTYVFSIVDTSNYDAEGAESGEDATVTSSNTSAATMTVATGGSLTATLESDSSDVVLSGSELMLAEYELEATDGLVNVTNLVLSIDGTTSTAAIGGKAYAYDGPSMSDELLGTFNFSGTSTTATSSVDIDVEDDEEVSVYILVDVAEIDGSGSGENGASVYAANMDVVYDSGDNTDQTATAATDNGIYTVYSSLPTLTQIDVDGNDELQNGDNTIYEFSLAVASEEGIDMLLDLVTFSIATTTADFSQATLYGYTNSAMTDEIGGFEDGATTTAAASTAFDLEATNLDLNAGETYYFKLVADSVTGVASDASIVTNLLGGSNFTWTPDEDTDTAEVNGAYIENFSNSKLGSETVDKD